MGKTEKIVVLGVVFAIVVLFVWSLDQGEPKAAPPEGEAAQRREAPAAPRSDVGPRIDPEALGLGRGSSAPAPAASPGAAPSPGSILPRPYRGAPDADGLTPQGALLSAGVETGSRPAAPATVVLRVEWDLVTGQGLEPTLDPEVFATAARDGDTWAALADRFYGDRAKERLLRRANEGTALTAGAVVLVPAVDTLPRTPEVREVEVLEGEGLWHVAKRALGNGARWKELHEANRDRITNPDFVKPGTVLRLP